MTKTRHGDEWNLRRSKLKLKIESVVPDLDCIPKRLRALNPEKVDKLAESMAEIGLLNPITVWSSSEAIFFSLNRLTMTEFGGTGASKRQSTPPTGNQACTGLENHVEPA